MKIKNFIPCPDEIIQEHGVYAAMIYGRIYRFSQKHGFCFASQDTIAAWLNISRSTVQKYIKLLVDNGYIEDMSEGVRNRPHRYRPKKEFDFYLGFEGDRETSTSDNEGDCETSSGDCEVDSGDRETSSTDRETSMNKGLKKEVKKEIKDNGISKAWQTVLLGLKSEIDKSTFDKRIGAAEVISFEDGAIVVCCNDPEWVASRLTTTIEGQLSGILNTDVSVTFDKERTV